VQQQAPGVARPVLEVSRRGEGCHTAHTQITGTGADAERSSGAEAGHPHTVDAFGAEKMIRRGEQIGEPPREREVAGRLARAPEVDRERDPAHLVGDALGEIRVRGRRGQPDIRTRRVPRRDHDAGKPCARSGRRTREVTGYAQPVGLDGVRRHLRVDSRSF
jgi:hypothetical protein